MLKQKEYLDDNFKAPSIKAKFFLNQLVLKDFEWKMKIKVDDILPRTYHEYKIEMVFDEAPYERQIEKLMDEKADLKDSKQKPLFKSELEDQLSDIDDKIEEMKEKMEEKRSECPTITMYAKVEELKYSGQNTMITFIIPDIVISELNENKLKFGSYLIDLTPQM